MKNFIESKMKEDSIVFKRPIDVLSKLFATRGSGIMLDEQNFLRSSEETTEPFVFSEPEPLESIYRWQPSEYQPFKQFTECRNKGFKEALQYFIKCIKITPDEARGIKEWKDNIKEVEAYLSVKPPVKASYSEDDVERFLKDVGYVRERYKGHIKKMYVFDTSDGCPVVVEDEIDEFWINSEFCKEYAYQVKMNKYLFEILPNTYLWFKSRGIKQEEQVLIYYW